MTAKVSDEIKQKIVKYLKTDKAKFVDPNTGKRTTKIDSYKLNEFVKNLLNLKTTDHAAKRISKFRLRYPSIFAGKVFKKPEMSEADRLIMRRKSVADYRKKFPIQRTQVEKNITKEVNPATGSTRYRLQFKRKGEKGFLSEYSDSLSGVRKLKKEHLEKFPNLKDYDAELVDDFIKSNLDQGNKIKHSELIAKIDDAGYPNPEDKLRRLIRYGDITHKDIIKDYQVAEPGEARKLFNEYDEVIAKAIKDKNTKAAIPLNQFLSKKLNISTDDAENYQRSASFRKKDIIEPKIPYYEAREKILKPEYDAAKKWYTDQKLPWNKKAVETVRKVISSNQDKWVPPKLKPELLDRAMVRVAQELKIDPDANEAQLARQIYGDDSIKNLKNIRADVSKFSEFLVGAREIAGLKLGNYSLAQKQELLGHIFYPGMFKFGSGLIGNRMVTVRDYLLKPSGRTLKSMLTALQPGLGHQRIDIDEVIGRAATYEKAPGYTELGQVLKTKINQDKGKLLDNNFSRIFNQIMDGKTKDFTLDGRKYNSVEDIAKAWNTKSSKFAKDYGIHTAQLRVGKDLDPRKLVKHFGLLTPEAQKDILRVARTKGLAIESEALPMTAMTDIWEARGKGIEPKSLSFYKSIVPEFARQVYATGDKDYINMWEERAGCSEGCLARKPGIVGRLLQKMPKGGRTGAILAGLGAVGAGTYAMMGGAEADTMKYNPTTGEFDNAEGEPETQEGILNWIADNPIKSGLAPIPALLGVSHFAPKAAARALTSFPALVAPALAAEKLYQYKEGVDPGDMALDPLNAIWALGWDSPKTGMGPTGAKGAYYAGLSDSQKLGLRKLATKQGWKDLPKAMKAGIMSPRAAGTKMVFPFAGPKAGAGIGSTLLRGGARLLPLGPIPLALSAGYYGWNKYKDVRDTNSILDSMRERGSITEEDADTLRTIMKQGWLGTTSLGAKILGSEELELGGEMIGLDQQKQVLDRLRMDVDAFQEGDPEQGLEGRKGVRAKERQQEFFNWFSDGGRVGMKTGGMDRRTFLKWIAGLAATATGLIKGKGLTQKAPVAKAVPKAVSKFQGVEGMPAWFPRAVAKIKAHGKLLSMADKDYVQGDMYEMMIPIQKYYSKGPRGEGTQIKTEMEKVIMEENPLTGEISMQWTGTDNFGDEAVRQINFRPGSAGYQKFGVDPEHPQAWEYQRVKVDEPEFSYSQPDQSQPYRDDIEYLDISTEGDEVVAGLEKMTGEVTKEGTVVDDAFKKKIYRDVDQEEALLPDPEGQLGPEGDWLGDPPNEMIEGDIPDWVPKDEWTKKAGGGRVGFDEAGIVGAKTGMVTEYGREVYETPEGEQVSEKSITLPLGSMWINVPSIHRGVEYNEDQLIQMLSNDEIQPTSIHETREEAERAAEERSDTMHKYRKGIRGGGMQTVQTGNIARRPGAVPPLSGPSPDGIMSLYSNPKQVNVG